MIDGCFGQFIQTKKTLYSQATKEKQRSLPSPSGPQVVPRSKKLVGREKAPPFPQVPGLVLSADCARTQKRKGGGSVVLGEGQCSFPTFFSCTLGTAFSLTDN